MNQNQYHPRGYWSGAFFGGALIIVGGIQLLSKLNFLGGLGLRELWPTLLIWFGVTKLLTKRPFRSALSSGLFWLVAGGVALVHTLSLLRFHWELLWPVLVILVGIKILFKGGGGGPSRGRNFPETVLGGEPRLDARLTMTGAKAKYDGRAFDGGTIRCVMAGYELDLRGAEMVGESCELYIEANLSGIELRVPRSWRVENEVTAVLGAVENRTTLVDVGAHKRLLIRGHVALSGVEIRN